MICWAVHKEFKTIDEKTERRIRGQPPRKKMKRRRWVGGGGGALEMLANTLKAVMLMETSRVIAMTEETAAETVEGVTSERSSAM